MPIPNRRKPRIYKGSMPPQQPKKQNMPPKYGNPDDRGRNELPMPERAAECRMQGQQQYIMKPTHTTPGKIPGTGAAPLRSKDTLAQEAKTPDAGCPKSRRSQPAQSGEIPGSEKRPHSSLGTTPTNCCRMQEATSGSPKNKLASETPDAGERPTQIRVMPLRG